MGLTHALTKTALAAKKPTKHGARQQAQLVIEKQLYDDILWHLIQIEAAADELRYTQQLDLKG